MEDAIFGIVIAIILSPIFAGITLGTIVFGALMAIPIAICTIIILFFAGIHYGAIYFVTMLPSVETDVLFSFCTGIILFGLIYFVLIGIIKEKEE